MQHHETLRLPRNATEAETKTETKTVLSPIEFDVVYRDGSTTRTERTLAATAHLAAALVDRMREGTVVEVDGRAVVGRCSACGSIVFGDERHTAERDRVRCEDC